MGLISGEATEPLLAHDHQKRFLQIFAGSILFCMAVLSSKATTATEAMTPTWCCPIAIINHWYYMDMHLESQNWGYVPVLAPLFPTMNLSTSSLGVTLPPAMVLWSNLVVVLLKGWDWAWEHLLEGAAPWPSSSSSGCDSWQSWPHIVDLEIY